METPKNRPDRGEELSRADSMLLLYGKRLGEVSESLGHFTDEKTGGRFAYNRSGIHQETVHSDILYFLQNNSAFTTNMPLNASYTEVDRRVHVKDAINFSGYLIATAGIFYNPLDEQQGVSKQAHEEIQTGGESAIPLIKTITEAVWKTGHVPFASDLASLVSVDELMQVVEAAIVEPRLQYIYKEVMRLVYTVLINNPPFDGDADAGDGRGGGGGGGKNPSGPRRGPGGCGCGRIIHSDEETRSHLERLIRQSPQPSREVAPV